jgi:formylglycine-generating enzyme required for sulfatase activity/Leucine-rich repeat (LRR) protein
MNPANAFARLLTLTLLVFVGITASTHAQEVLISDPGLNAAVREALDKPVGPLSQQDLLTLTSLSARNRNVKSIAGLEAARNLVSLDLQINRLTNFVLPGELTKIMALDVSINPLTNVLLPSGLTNLQSLTIEACGLTDLTLPADLTALDTLDLENNQLTRFDALSNLTSLVDLDLGFNAFTNFFLPNGLTNLSSFYFAGNPLRSVTLPSDLRGMTELNLSQNLLAKLSLPTGMTKLVELDLAFNQLTNLSLPGDLFNLSELQLDFNRLSTLSFASNLTRLDSLHLRANEFTNFALPAELAGLTYLDLSTNPVSNIVLPAGMNRLTTLRISDNTNLTRLILPAGLTNLTAVNLSANQLTNIVLRSDMNHLDSLNLGGNRFTSITFPPGLSNLTELFLTGNQLTNITLPPDMALLTDFGYLGNPLETFVLSEVTATNLAADVTFLQNRGVNVFTYPLTIELIRIRQPIGAFQFAITGPPGNYTVLGSFDLEGWSPLMTVANRVGAVVFTDGTAHLSTNKFYRALLQGAPTNMVFVAPNTFTMGSPTTEQDRDNNEGPQTTVTLTRGFWIGKYEVTQGEYLSLMNTNPSFFPGDPSRPVSSVSWPDATNYCAKLTERELAAGRISGGSRFRMPTEAEWECAARAGTTTRFSYGDDPNYMSLTNYAWLWSVPGMELTVYPVGQKLPNPWGLYDIYGNVWEWCEDWLGPLPGGTVTDPTGPDSNPIGLKVVRGGGYDFGPSDCRSARRFFFPSHPLLTDTDIGFRVVLVNE